MSASFWPGCFARGKPFCCSGPWNLYARVKQDIHAFLGNDRFRGLCACVRVPKRHTHTHRTKWLALAVARALASFTAKHRRLSYIDDVKLHNILPKEANQAEGCRLICEQEWRPSNSSKGDR